VLDGGLRVVSVSKSYGRVDALVDVSLAVQPGEVHALVGENGSGKSTLVKILAGSVRPDRGEIWYRGRQLSLSSPSHAHRAGIATVFQELSVIPSLTVAENISLLALPRTPAGTIDRKAVLHRAEEVVSQYGFHVNLDARCSSLSVQQLQLVELARALSSDPNVLVLDEATSALDAPEAAEVIRICRDVAGAGRAVVFISHRLDEVFQVADWCSVLRDGHLISTRSMQQTSRNDMLQDLLGDKAAAILSRHALRVSSGGPPLLKAVLPRACWRGREDVSFALSEGEIVGLAGLQGQGQKEVLQVVAGDLPGSGKQLLLGDRPISVSSPADALRHGLCYVPEDRHRDGLLSGHSVLVNLTLAVLKAVSRFGFLNRRLEIRLYHQMVAQLGIHVDSWKQPIESLSGGNQQKVLLGRVLLARPRVLLLDDPTRGIDVGAKADVYETLRSLADQGVGVLLNSTEIKELAGVCDRVLVFHDRRLVAQLAGDETTERHLLHAMLGESRSEIDPRDEQGSPQVDGSPTRQQPSGVST
jgi:ribose transport system ATP-binding protein